ncbi:FMN-dependent L-lactate dehydrogenase LldD [soil metagenome]
MPRIANITDFRAEAKRRLPSMIFNYIDGGAYAETTLARNVDDLNAIALRQRVMKDVSSLSMGVALFGQKLPLPVILGPIGMAGLYARRGEVQAAQAAQKAGVPFTLSTVSICSLEEVCAAVTAPPWFQLYMIKDRGFMAALLERAKAAGVPVLMFTVDLPTPGSRYRDVRTGLAGALSLGERVAKAVETASHPAWIWDVGVNGRPHGFGNIMGAVEGAKGPGDFQTWVGQNFDPSVTWADIEWVRARWDGPIVIKGVLDPEDARQAVAHGADGIVVSNHGGRQLDGVLSGASALPPIVQAVGDRTTVLMDGGVRSGLDVLKALSLGAKGVMLGRAWAFALAAKRGEGVSHMLRILKSELRVAMMLTGCTDVRDAGPDLLVERETPWPLNRP